MNTIALIVLSIAVSMTTAAPGIFYGAFPAPVADTKVVRDYLGNQATAYAYQDGHSSAVALSRKDVSKHLVAAPAPVVAPIAPAVYSAPATYAHAAPAVYAAPAIAHTPAVYHAPAHAVPLATSYQYNHRFHNPAVYAAPHYYY